MVEYHIATNNVPLGGTAVAEIQVTDSGVADDMESITFLWKDNNGNTISSASYTSTDVSTTGANGEAVTITNPAGTGNYKGTLLILNDGTWSPPTSGLTFSLTITVVDQSADGGGTKTEVFYFKIVPSTLSVTLDTSAVSTVIRRKANLTKDIPILAEGAETEFSLGRDIVYTIESATLNATAITAGTEYNWVTGRPNVTIPVAQAPSDNDFYVFRCGITLDATGLQDYIRMAEREIASALQPFYSDTALLTYPTITNLLIEHAVGHIKMDFSEGTALESARYRTGRDQVNFVKDAIREIQMGRFDILDSSGAVVSRKTGAIAGGFRSGTAYTNSQEVREKLADFNRIVLPFSPLPYSTTGLDSK